MNFIRGAPKIERFAGRFQLTGPLGNGELFEVLEAIDGKRKVAIKRPKKEALGHDIVGDMFNNEVSALIRFNNSRIVKLMDFGEHEGWPYMVVEKIEGISLERLKMNRGIKRLDQLLKLFSEVCSGLETIHRWNMIHRDISPLNILVTGNTIKIIDFAIARFPGYVECMRDGLVFGTADFIAPEQGFPSADSRSDIYSLGRTMMRYLSYDLHPVPRTNDAGSIRPPPFLLNLHAPDDLFEMLAKASNPNRDLRYASAAEMKEEIDRLAGKVGNMPI